MGWSLSSGLRRWGFSVEIHYIRPSSLYSTAIYWVYSLSIYCGRIWYNFENYTKGRKPKVCIDYELKRRQIWGIWKLRPGYSPETPNLGQNRWCFVPCDLEISWMTLENNRASLLCCFKLCATFHSHRWIQTGVTVRKRPIWVKFNDF